MQKRRIYDITNVLEGVNLIEKQSKNIIRFQAMPGLGAEESDELEGDEDEDEEADELPPAPRRVQGDVSDEVALLRAQEAALDERLALQQRELQRLLSERAPWAYVRHEDMRQVPSLREQTIIAVRAETGTRLEVPDPDEGAQGRRRYQIYLQSAAPIDVFLVSLLDSELLEMEAAQDHIAQQLNAHVPAQPAPHEGAPSLLRPPADLNVDYFFNTTAHEGVSDLF